MNNMGLGMRIRTLVVGLVLSLMATDLFAASDVQSVRLWRAPDNTRLVFDLSGPVEHKIFTLTAPDRLVIDVTGATLKAELDKLALQNTPVASCAPVSTMPTRCAWWSTCTHPFRRRASAWRPTSSMDTVWWSICSTRPLRPVPPPSPGDRHAVHPGCSGLADSARGEAAGHLGWQA